MLSEHTPTTTLATANPQLSREFYEGVLGFEPKEEAGGGIFYQAGSGSFFVYESSFAGTNQATSMTFELSPDEFDQEIGALRQAGVTFDTFEMQGIEWDGDVAVFDEMRSVWFKDPDGNILNVEAHA
jgi:catechol 2,3-dioxygenase-like lactoylglutathione lyase family enzyme